MLLNSVYIHAANIKGNIRDEKNRPIEFANITLFSANDTVVVSTTFSDSSGFFELLNIPRGDYFLEISYLNYKKDSLLISAFEDSVEIGTISLLPLANNLDLVTITANKPIYERKADRIIFNVENSVYSQGSDAMQALSKAPRVQVNNNDIKIAGRGDAAVLINDRLIRMSGEELSQYLKSIPSSDIQKIEVIPNPPAKYDAQGVALINIVLKKNRKQGWNGSAYLTYKQATFAQGYGGASFNINKKKISFKTSLGGGRYIFQNTIKNSIDFSNEKWNSNAVATNKSYSIYGSLGLDYDVNTKHTIGINYMAYYSNSDNYKENNRTDITNNVNDLFKNIQNNSTNINSTSQHTLNTYYIYKIDSTGKKLDAGFDFFTGKTDNQRNYINATYSNNDSLLIIPIPTENTVGNYRNYYYDVYLNMEHPVKYGTWSYGSKYSSFKINSNNVQSVLLNDDYVVDNTRSSHFIYNEYITALYASFEKTIKKIEIQAGLRLEYTHSKGKLINSNSVTNRDYIQPFPRLYVSYKKNEKHSISFSTNTRIERPHFSMLNPFRYYINENSYSTGNPFLQPQYSYNLSLDYSFKQFYTISGYYNYLVHENNEITFADTSINNNFIQWQSKDKTHDLGIYQELNLDVKDRWSIRTSLDVSLDITKSPYFFNANKRTYWNMQFDINNDFILDKQNRFIASIYYLFRPPNRGYIESKSRIYNQLDLGIRAKLLKNRQLSIAFNAYNILRSTYDGYGYTPNGNKISHSIFFDTRQFIISIIYKFGNDKLKQKYRQQNMDIDRAK